jgi:hypothetical protein
MPESAAHATLVQAIIIWAEREFGTSSELAVREDVVSAGRCERPPRVGGFVPDVYATDVPTTRTLIGEAKTRQDLETDHSRQQIEAFLEHLAHTPNGVFVLSVPLAAAATARRQVAELMLRVSPSATRTVILDGITR